MSTNDDRLSDESDSVDESDSYDEEEDRPFREWDSDLDDLKNIVHDVRILLREKNFDGCQDCCEQPSCAKRYPGLPASAIEHLLSYVPGQPVYLRLEVAQSWLKDALNDSNIDDKTRSEIRGWKDVLDKMFEDTEESQQEWVREQDQEQEQEQVALSDTVKGDNVEDVDKEHQEQERVASPNRFEEPRERTEVVNYQMDEQCSALAHEVVCQSGLGQAAMRLNSALGHVNEKEKEGRLDGLAGNRVVSGNDEV